MTGRGTHNPSLRICVFFYIKVFLYSAFLFFSPISTGLAIEHTSIEKVSPPPDNEPVYIIPEQPDSPLKFGVSITPGTYIHSIDYRLSSSYINPFDEEYQVTQHAEVSTVVRIALDEFKFFSGLNHWICDVEKTMNVYCRKFMLTGEINLDPQNTDPVDYIEKVNFVAEIYKAEYVRPHHRNKIKSIFSQFEINKVTWNMVFHLDSPQVAFKLGIGDAIMIHSSAGEDVKVGAMIKLSI
ncbi:MAG: hypothetical protein HF978_21000 [Desulfobacteraceae bacterium]|nr:hypothetical protein [Desulfobacteraceae bacterium]MBC2758028.1 hypothetical protein [Desulfobacteraceae bacterium]